MRLQGSAELNKVREAVGLRPVERPARLPTPGQSAPEVHVPPSWVTRPGRCQDDSTRLLIGLVAVVSVAVALTHQLLAGALSRTHGAGPFGAAAAVLGWPTPMLQPILAGVGALTVCAIGVFTGGWREVGRRQNCLLVAGVMAAVFGAGPMILVCTLIAVVCVLIVILIIVIVFYILTQLS
jgi:hypothetical protein